MSALLLAACGGATPAPRSQEAPAQPERYAIALRFEDAGVDQATDTPHTRVLLVRIAPDGTTEPREVSREAGVCHHEAQAGALMGAQCWWAGAGARIRVERREGRVVALRVELDEQAPESAPLEVGSFEVPEDAELDLVAPGAMPVR